MVEWVSEKSFFIFQKSPLTNLSGVGIIISKEKRMSENADIKPKYVADLEGIFSVPAYQRGYRWEKRQVEDLLNDIWHHAEINATYDYCLQPVVLSNNKIVDGQQRFTTIYIILKYLNAEIKYTLSYDTRDIKEAETDLTSKEFLANINTITEINDNKSDFYHMSNAFLIIKKWFEEKSTGKNFDKELFLQTLNEKTFFVWYEIESTKKDESDVF